MVGHVIYVVLYALRVAERDVTYASDVIYERDASSTGAYPGAPDENRREAACFARPETPPAHDRCLCSPMTKNVIYDEKLHLCAL